jgi:myo-inositol-1(or 4)-monophosphatase
MTQAELELRRYAVQGLVAEAGRMALDYFGKQESLGVTMKGAQDWLTVADGAVEDFLRQRLSVLFPTDTVIGEEGGGAASDTVWIIDPIDGTSNFARGDRNWCISIGFLLNRVPTIGIVAAPALDELYVAQRGQGATLNGRPIAVSGAEDLKRACVELGWSTRIPFERYLAVLQRWLRRRLLGEALWLGHAGALPCRERAHRRLCRAAHQCLGRRGRHRHRQRGGRLDQ